MQMTNDQILMTNGRYLPLLVIGAWSLVISPNIP